jgi:hypothetical protein
MRKRTGLFFLLLAFSTARLAANDIEPTKEFYTAYRMTNTFNLDGKLDEWAGVPVLSDPRFSIKSLATEGTSAGKGSGTNGVYVLFERYQGGDWTGPDDHTSAVQVAWDAGNVYFGFVVTDDYHENAAASAWNGDSIQLMIASSNRTAQVALYNYALGGVEGAFGEVIVNHEAGPGGTEAIVTRDGTRKKTIYEIKLPADSLKLKAPLQAGTKFGLGMAINDGDELTPGQKGWGGLGAHSIVFGKTPKETALVTLGTNVPGSDRLFFSAISQTMDSFTFRATDKGTSVVDPANAKLTLDGQTYPLTAGPKTGDATDFSYKPASPFAGGSEHAYTIEVKDTAGNAVTSSGTFVLPAYAYLTAADKVTPDTSKPGFIWNIHQNEAFTATDNVRPANQLTGSLGENNADRTAQGAASGPGTAGANNRLPIRFEIPGVINLDQAAGSFGNVQPDEQMPGVPGTTGSADGLAVEILTYVDLPAGKTTMIVNSDDGFITTAGVVSDALLAQVAGEFNQGRGSEDTSFTVYAQEAGNYAFRTVYENGTGGANIEWLSLKADGSKVLLNDATKGGLKTYRAAVGASPAVVREASPLPGQVGVALNAPVRVVIQDGATAVEAASVKLSMDGAQVNATATKAGDLTTLQYQPTAFWASGSKHTASVSYTAGTTPRTQSWQFTVEAYPTLTKAHQAVSVDKSKPGFKWNVFQNETYTHNSLAETELALSGKLVNGNGDPVTDNYADPGAIGPALGAGVTAGPLVKFEIPTVINLSQNAGDTMGNFFPDDQFPGIPGTTGANDGIDAEAITFVELPAGLVTLGVNSDDGFRAQAGYINVPADGVLLGEFDAGRGATDTIMRLVAQESGVYPLRVIWQEGGGDANIEIFSVKADGTKLLINDTAAGAYKSYRVGVAPTKPVSVDFTLAAKVTGGAVEISWTEPGVTLEQSANLQTWTAVPGATSPYRPTTTGGGASFFRLKK